MRNARGITPLDRAAPGAGPTAGVSSPASVPGILGFPGLSAFQIPGTGVTSFLFVNATGKSPSEILAAEALNQAILRFEVGRVTL